MSLLKKRWKRKKVAPNFQNIFHLSEFLKESDSSIEKAVFWTSNFLSVPTSGKSLLNLKSSQDKRVRERLKKIKVVVNVGGERFVIPYKTISHYPDTLLATREIERYFDQRRKEYFFDRDPDMFRYVFKFYKDDKIHYPMDECIQALIDEFKFFRIPLDIIKDCCYAEFHLELENNSNCNKCAKQKRPARLFTNATRLHQQSKSFTLRNRVFVLLNDPSSGSEAKAVAIALLLCVFLNILGIVLETLPCSSGSKKCGELYRKEFFLFDMICVLILTLEFLVTLAVQKKRKVYFCCLENLVFFCSLFTAYITWFLYITLGFSDTPVYLDDSLKALRVFRLVKIAKTSTRLRETVSQIVSAARGLRLVLAACCVAIIVLSVLLYNLDDSFSHVPIAMWYFVVTMTTLGYGDCVPVTPSGKLLGIVGLLLGILVLALPVPIIQNKLGASIDEVEPEPDEVILDNLYPPDFADRQRRLSRMISLDHRMSNLKHMEDDQ